MRTYSLFIVPNGLDGSVIVGKYDSIRIPWSVRTLQTVLLGGATCRFRSYGSGGISNIQIKDLA